MLCRMISFAYSSSDNLAGPKDKKFIHIENKMVDHQFPASLIRGITALHSRQPSPRFFSLSSSGYNYSNGVNANPSSPLRFRFRFSLPLNSRLRAESSENQRGETEPGGGGILELGRLLLSEEEKMSDVFYEAIEELERMVRDPSHILEEMNDKLSAREFHLVLVYFSQQGRDSWCALEVFDWLRKENRADSETVELMVSIMCTWIHNLVQDERPVTEVLDLLRDMDCVGLKPSFSMFEKVISTYWDLGKKDQAILFLKDVLQHFDGNNNSSKADGENKQQGPTSFILWKMILDGDYRGAFKFVIELRRECGLKPEPHSYVVALTALVKELNELSRAIRKLKSLHKIGLVGDLDAQDMGSVDRYRSELLDDGVLLSNWAMQEEPSIAAGVIHEKLLAMYTCAGRGIEAEHQLWQMKLAGKEPDRELYDIVLAICASQKNLGAVRRLLTGIETLGIPLRKKTLSWLLRGFIKGGHLEDASETLLTMLDRGIRPDHLDTAVVLQGLRKSMPQNSGNLELYLKLCKNLSAIDMVGPCLAYMYISQYKLWIMKML